MIKRIREKIHSLPTGVHLLASLITGAVLNTLLFGMVLGVYFLSDLHINSILELIIPFYSVFLCIISGLLEEDLKGTVLSCIGASTIVLVPFMINRLWTVCVIIVFLFSLHGICLYYAGNPGFKAAFLRCLSIIPTVYGIFSKGDGKPWYYVFLLLVLGVLGYFMAGRKNKITVESLVLPFFMITMAALLFSTPIFYMLYVLFNPDYYP